MRIAQIAPLYERVPPTTYGGTERVVSYLTDELVRRGHDVTLFASADSETLARLVSVIPGSIRSDPTIIDPHIYMIAQVGLVFDHATDFDLIHSHVDYFTYPLTRHVNTPTVTTLHGRLDLPELQVIYHLYPDVNLISISDAQRAPLRDVRWVANVYNGIPMEDFTLQPTPGDYLAFVGRIAPEKRVDLAIEIAKRYGIRLKIAAKVDRADLEYYEEIIKPMLDHPLVEFIGEIDQKAKDQFLGGAYAFIFPIDWPEPFGLAMAEAMACGTPVIAARAGSVPEIVLHEKTGFICDSIDEMLRALDNVGRIDRRFCRDHVSRNFSVTAMVDGYEAAYEKVLAGHLSARRLRLDGGALSDAAAFAFGDVIGEQGPVRIRPSKQF